MLDWFALRNMPTADAQPHTVIYDWRPFRGFHILYAFPGALRLSASVDDRVEDLLSEIPPSTDTFLFNLDMTCTSGFPAGRQELIAELRRRKVDIWNEHVTDVSKRNVQQVCRFAGLPDTGVERTGDPEELLIVKSNANYGGKSERALTNKERERLGVPPPCETIQTEMDYKVVPRKAVPDPCWSDERINIERYIQNRGNLFYRVRMLFDTWVVSEAVCPDLIKKRRNITQSRDITMRRGEAAEFPAALLDTAGRFQDAFRMDYGALDLMMDDDERFYVVDANATPGMDARVGGRAAAFTEAWERRRRERFRARPD